jgi:hypothetical protein
MRRMRRIPIGAAVAILLAVATGARAKAAEVELVVPESVVRTAPSNAAPEIARVKGPGRLPADDTPHRTFRRVQLPDGRWGFLPDADVAVTLPSAPAAEPPAALPTPAPAGETPPPAAPTSAPAVPASAPTVMTAAREPEPRNELPTRLGVVFSIFPVGTFARTAMTATGTSNASSDTAFAVGVAPTLDFLASPYMSLGISPQAIFRVRTESGTGQSSTEYDIRGRVTGRLPLSAAGTAAYARLSPGFSVVALPEPAANVMSARSPKGFVVDLSVGLEVAVLPRLFAIVDLGYQWGFQSATLANVTFQGTRYLHLGAGFAVAF